MGPTAVEVALRDLDYNVLSVLFPGSEYINNTVRLSFVTVYDPEKGLS